MQKNTAIKSELDSDTSEEVDDSIYEDVTPEWYVSVCTIY